jgi:cytoskeletal protein CcmA (bactofilin family)
VKEKSKNLSIIDKDLVLDGSISSMGNLVIRGRVQGSLVGEKVVIAEEGALLADVEVSSLTIGGVFEGEVRASKELIILSTGSCTGTVCCESLIVESGGLLNAGVSFSTNSPPTKSKKADSDKKDKSMSSITV